MIFTTSWDDGYALDRRIATLLETHNCAGTFYISPREQHGARLLTKDDLRSLAAKHEIGAHTMTHPRLTRIPLEQARREIAESKAWVESAAGKEAVMFCYPYGDENGAVRSLVREAGFRGARIVEQMRFAATDPFAMPTTLQVTPYPFRRRFSRWWHVLDFAGPLRVRRKALRSLRTPFRAYGSWLALASFLFTRARETDQSFFHLWGHSHEIDRFSLWEDLDRFLAFVARHDDVERAVNSRLLSSLS